MSYYRVNIKNPTGMVKIPRERYEPPFPPLRASHDHVTLTTRPLSPPGARGLGPGAEAPLHLARPVREGRHLPPLPRRHARDRPGRLRRRQRRLLDADPSRQRSVSSVLIGVLKEVLSGVPVGVLI